MGCLQYYYNSPALIHAIVCLNITVKSCCVEEDTIAVDKSLQYPGVDLIIIPRSP